MEIQNLLLTRLRNEEHHQFMTEFSALVDKYSATALGISSQFTEFTAQYLAISEGLKLVQASAHTLKVTQADDERDETYRSLYLVLKGYCGHYDPSKRDAAHRLRLVFENFGELTTLPYAQETATIASLLGILASSSAADVALLGLTDWTNTFAEQNSYFNSLLQLRYDENANKPTVHIKTTRKAIDALYYSMIKRINSLIEVNGLANYANFATDINVRIAHYKQVLAMRNGRVTNGDETQSPQA